MNTMKFAVEPLDTGASFKTKAYAALKSAISQMGIYDHPSEIRLDERQLCEALGVSRTPVREALLGLEKDGFVKSIPGRGFVVTQLSAEEARRFYPILWTLEGLAVRSGKPDPERLAELRSLNQLLHGASSIEERVRLDSQWHATLVAAANNPVLQRMVDGVRSSVYRYEYAYLASYDWRDHSCEEHSAIVDLFERDPGAAADAVEQHWKDGLHRLLELVDRES